MRQSISTRGDSFFVSISDLRSSLDWRFSRVVSRIGSASFLVLFVVGGHVFTLFVIHQMHVQGGRSHLLLLVTAAATLLVASWAPCFLPGRVGDSRQIVLRPLVRRTRFDRRSAALACLARSDQLIGHAAASCAALPA